MFCFKYNIYLIMMGRFCFKGGVCVCHMFCMIIFMVYVQHICCSSPAWCLRNEGVSSVLLGASNTDQLMENIGAIQVRMQTSVWQVSIKC